MLKSFERSGPNPHLGPQTRTKKGAHFFTFFTFYFYKVRSTIRLKIGNIEKNVLPTVGGPNDLENAPKWACNAGCGLQGGLDISSATFVLHIYDIFPLRYYHNGPIESQHGFGGMKKVSGPTWHA